MYRAAVELKKILQEKKLTQKKAGLMMGFTQTYVNHVCTGRRDIVGWDFMNQAYNVFKIKHSWWFEEVECQEK